MHISWLIHDPAVHYMHISWLIHDPAVHFIHTSVDSFMVLRYIPFKHQLTHSWFCSTFHANQLTHSWSCGSLRAYQLTHSWSCCTLHWHQLTHSRSCGTVQAHISWLIMRYTTYQSADCAHQLNHSWFCGTLHVYQLTVRISWPIRWLCTSAESFMILRYAVHKHQLTHAFPETAELTAWSPLFCFSRSLIFGQLILQIKSYGAEWVRNESCGTVLYIGWHTLSPDSIDSGICT